MKNTNYIVTQLKNENKRIKEWVEFHLKNGFDKIIIFLDHPTDGSDIIVKELSESNENILWFYTIHGIPMQTPYGTLYTGTTNYQSSNDYHGNVTIAHSLAFSYQRGLDYIKENFKISDNDWVAFIDVDEFIVQTGKTKMKDFLLNLSEQNIDRLYITSYDMKCPIDLNKSVIEQSLYRWSSAVRNNSVFISRGKMMGKINNLSEILCVHTLDSDFNKNPNKFTKTMSTGGDIIKSSNSNVIDVFHNEEYFKLFHYRNDGLLQVYDRYDDSALKLK